MRLWRTSARMKICSANILVCVVKQGCLTYFVQEETWNMSKLNWNYRRRYMTNCA